MSDLDLLKFCQSLVAGYWADPNSTLIVEEPEIHLHPRAQSELGHFVYQMYRNKVQVILETHSEHLVLRIQRLVAEGRIPPKDVIIYYVYPRAGKKTFSVLGLTEEGMFQGKWPEGFFPERLVEGRAILKAPAARRQREARS